MRKGNSNSVLSNQQLERELKRTTHIQKQWLRIRRMVSSALVLAAVIALLSIFCFPVYYITGESMEPSLMKGQIIIARRINTLNTGDIIALYYNNQILIRRIIGMPGDVIDIDGHGIVSINDIPIDEPYLNEKALGLSDMTYPVTVPDHSYFVMGDNRNSSIDSRMSIVGCIPKEKIAGKIIFSIWPLHQAGYIGWGESN